MKARGFTLTEVLVAMAILGLGVVGTAPLVVMAINRSAQARHVTVAQQVAGDLLENLRAELRYDAEAQSPPTAIAGVPSWKAPVLPHTVQEPTAPAAACVNGVCCQPEGQDDGITYHYGPFAYALEGNTYWVCYALQQMSATDSAGQARLGIPPTSAEAVVRVLWRGADSGWRSLSVGDLLLDGR